MQDGDDGHIQDYVFRYFADRRYEPTTSVLLSTICEELLPQLHKIWAHAKEVQKASGARYAEFWPAAIDLMINKAEELLPLTEYTTLREALEAKLKEKLAPGYRYKRDREHWADVLTEALRRILLSDILPCDAVNLTSDLWKKLLAPIDSQLLATIVEDILANQDAVGQFLATTLFGTEVNASHPLFKAFGKGLKARYFYICSEVPDPDSRKLFNSTGLSAGGNKIIEANRDILLEAVGETIADPSTRQDAIVRMLSIAHEIPDLEPEEIPRTLNLIIDWMTGRSLEEIATDHFDSDVGDAVRTIERDVARKIAWGVNAITQHIKAAGFPVDDAARWLKNLPAMVGLGVPSPVAAFAASQGIASRRDCIAISEAFASEDGGEGYRDFIAWFSFLHQRKDAVDILRDAGDFKSILDLSEQRSRGYKGTPPKVTFRLDQDYGLADGQEVLFFQSSNDGFRYQALTTKYSPAFTITLKTRDFHRWIRAKDYIARYVQAESSVEVEFV